MRRKGGKGASQDSGEDGMKKSGSQLSIDKGRNEQKQELVKKVMGTSSGDNAELAKKIHARYEQCASILIRLIC